MSTEAGKVDAKTAGDIVSNMKTYTKPMVAVIYGVINENEGETVGTGTFIKINGKIYILTALHVLKKARNNAPYKGPAYSCLLRDANLESGEPVHQIAGAVETVENFDLALTEIDPSTVSSDQIPELSTMLAPSQNLSPEELVFVHGCPGKRNRFSPLAGANGGIIGETVSLLRQTAQSNDNDFQPDHYIAIDYRMTGNIALDGPAAGKPIELPLAFGFSGSSLWRVNWSEKDWSPSRSRLIGLLPLWHPRDQQIWAVRSEIIFAFLASLA